MLDPRQKAETVILYTRRVLNHRQKAKTVRYSLRMEGAQFFAKKQTCQNSKGQKRPLRTEGAQSSPKSSSPILDMSTVVCILSHAAIQ